MKRVPDEVAILEALINVGSRPKEKIRSAGIETLAMESELKPVPNLVHRLLEAILNDLEKSKDAIEIFKLKRLFMLFIKDYPIVSYATLPYWKRYFTLVRSYNSNNRPDCNATFSYKPDE